MKNHEILFMKRRVKASSDATNSALYPFHFVLAGGGQKSESNEDTKLNTNAWALAEENWQP